MGENPATVGKVRWYFAPPGAKVYRGVTNYRSLDTVQKDRDLPGFGPVDGAPRKWVNGRADPLYTGQGEPCGAQWFATGVPFPPPDNPVVNPDGVPVCCTNHRFASWASPGVSGGTWVTLPVPLPGIRQESAVNGNWNQAALPFLPFATIQGSGLVVVLGVMDFGHGTHSVVTPSGWTLQQQNNSGPVSMYWFTKFNAPGGVVFQPFSMTWSGFGFWGISSWEITGLLSGGSVDVKALASGQGGMPVAPDTVIVDTVDIAIGVLWSTNSVPVLPGENWLNAPNAGNPFGVVNPVYKQVVHGETVRLSCFHPDIPLWAVGTMSLPLLPVPGGSLWFGFGTSGDLWQTDDIFRSPWAGSAVSSGTWAGVGLVSSAWAGSAVSSGTWAGVGLVSSAWAGSAASSGTWAGVGLVSSAWAGSAASSGTWAGLAVTDSAWANTAASSGGWAADRAGTYKDQHTNAATTGTSLSATWGTALVSGVYEFVWCAGSNGVGSAPVFTAPSGAGWTQFATISNAGTGQKGTITVFYKVASGGETSTGTFTATNCSGGMITEAWTVAGITATTANWATSPLTGTSTAPSCGPLTPSVWSVFMGMVCSVANNISGPWSPSGTQEGNLNSGVTGPPSTTEAAGLTFSSSVAITFSDTLSTSVRWCALELMLPQGP